MRGECCVSAAGDSGSWMRAVLARRQTAGIQISLRLIMATLRSRCGNYIFVPFLLSSFFLSSNLSHHRLDVYHTSTHDVALCP